MQIKPIQDVIPESRIVVFSPHYDDVLFMLGGYISELKKQGYIDSKNFHLINVFSRSNYLARTGDGNFDTSLERIKLATGHRLLEDLNCMDELIGPFRYTFELSGETECLARGKTFADSEMEFPHGMYDDFNEKDYEIFARMQEKIREWAMHEHTALVFPIAFKEHIDHFIVREAAVKVAQELGANAKATFYFQEDKPYGGLADEEELARIEQFVNGHPLEARAFNHHPEEMIDLAFKHYISQVEDVYKKGIRQRSEDLQEMYAHSGPVDRIYLYRRQL